MLANAFIARPTPPTDADVAAALGTVGPVWRQLLDDLIAAQTADRWEWKSHSLKWGWTLRVVRKQRTIVWLSPGRGGFNVLFILGERARAAARDARLPRRVAAAVATAVKYPEGSGVRLVVRSARDLPALRTLAAIKLAH